MSTDGGGYTYYIIKDKRNGVSSASTIPKFCRDFYPVDIVSPKQVSVSSFIPTSEIKTVVEVCLAPAGLSFLII